jgi:hypothetical protein
MAIVDPYLKVRPIKREPQSIPYLLLVTRHLHRAPRQALGIDVHALQGRENARVVTPSPRCTIVHLSEPVEPSLCIRSLNLDDMNALDVMLPESLHGEVIVGDIRVTQIEDAVFVED